MCIIIVQSYTLNLGGCTMKEVKLLKNALKSQTPMNAARLFCLAGIIIALLKVRTVNFTQLAVAFPGKAKKRSKYRRIQRFFESVSFDYTLFAKLIVKFLGIKDKLWTLTIDRTNWKFGKLNINILTLGIAHLGAAFPILWSMLPKRGNSNTEERIELIDRFIKIFGVNKIKCITGDREFIGKKWFSYLIGKLITVRLRIKENTLVTNSRGIPVPAKTLFRFLKPGEYCVLEGKRTVLEQELFIIALKQPNGEYVILVANRDPEQAMEDYKKRWEIETLFGCLKTRGFNFESTHLIDTERIKKLVAILAIAFCWCHITGEWAQNQKPIRIKKHGRKAISIFRYGLDILREIVLNISEKFNDFKKMVKLFVKCIFSSALDSKPMKQNIKFLSCT